MSLAGALKAQVNSYATNQTLTIPANTAAAGDPPDQYTWIGSTLLSSVLSLNAANSHGDVLYGQLYISVESMPSGIPGGLLQWGLAPVVPGTSRGALVQGNSASDGNSIGLDPSVTKDLFGNTISSTHPLDIVGGITMWGTDFLLYFSCQTGASATSVEFNAGLVVFNTVYTGLASNSAPLAAPSPHMFPASLQS